MGADLIQQILRQDAQASSDHTGIERAKLVRSHH